MLHRRSSPRCTRMSERALQANPARLLCAMASPSAHTTLPHRSTLRCVIGPIAARAHWLAFGIALAWLLAVWPNNAIAQGAPVYRCGSSYSQAPCPGGRAIANQLSTLHDSTAASPGRATVYLCQGIGGGQFWSSSHCGQHQATIERMETVPASLPWSQQVQQAQTQSEQAQQLSEPYRPDHDRRHPQRANASRAQERAREARQEQKLQQRDQQQAAACSALRARLARLDAQGRAGSQQTNLEDLRAQRRQAREELRERGC